MELSYKTKIPSLQKERGFNILENPKNNSLN